jgi:hypothetical protein
MIASGSRPARLRRRGWLGEDAQRGAGVALGVDGETVVQRRDGDAEPVRGCSRGRARPGAKLARGARRGTAAGQEFRERCQHPRPELGGKQHFGQGFAPARGIGRDQHPARIAGEEGRQRRCGRAILRRDGEVRRRLRAQRLRFGMAWMLRAADFDPLAGVEALAQCVGRQVELGRWQQRALDVVPALLVALRRLGMELVGGVERTFAEQRQGVGGQVVEQRRGRFEEQRQVVLDAGRCDTGLQVLEQRAATAVDVEAFAQRRHRPLRRSLVHRHFPARQQSHRVDLVERALGVGVEGADRIDLVVQQFHPVGFCGAHRENVEQAAAHGEIARVHDLRHVAVAGGRQPALLRLQVERLADIHVEGVADHVAQRRQPLQERLHRHDHDAAPERGQPVQRGQALADDVRMRAELVVGQGFPVRERHHRQRRVLAKQGAQVGFELVRSLVVARDRQQRAGMPARGLRDRPRQRRRRRGRAPERALLAGAGQRRDGEGRWFRHQAAISRKTNPAPAAGLPAQRIADFTRAPP